MHICVCVGFCWWKVLSKTEILNYCRNELSVFTNDKNFYNKSLSDVGLLGHNVRIQTELKHIKTYLVTHVVRSSLVSYSKLPLASGGTILWLSTSKYETIENWIEKSNVNNTDWKAKTFQSQTFCLIYQSL